MTLIEFFKKQYEEEGAITRKFLALVKEDDFGFKPHPRSMVMKELVMHLADLPGWVHLVLTTSELDFSTPYVQPPVNDAEELMAYFEQRYQQGLSMLVPENEAQMQLPWTLRNGDIIYLTDPKVEMIRTSISQQIHHRAQLGVYLRLLDIPIPGSYGPSADENEFAAMEVAAA